MRIFRSLKTGMITIWSKDNFGDYIYQQYLDMPIKDCLKNFRKKFPRTMRSMKGCKKTDFFPLAIS